MLLLIGGTALVGISFVVWYQQERPLIEIETTLQQGKVSPAFQLVGQFLRLHPDSARGQILKARILVQAGQPDEALRIFERYGASDISELQAWATAHLMRKEWSNALPVFERILQLYPDDPDALQGTTSCRTFLGDFRAALDSAARLTQQPGREARAWLQIGTLHKSLGNDRSAIGAWDRVLKYEPGAEHLPVSPAEFFGEFGRVLLHDGRLEQARESLEHSLALADSAQAHSDLGQAFQQLGEEGPAVVHWRRACELNPALGSPRESLAQMALRAGQFEMAREWLEPAVRSPLSTSSATYLMERACQGLNQIDAAQMWHEQTERRRKREKLHAAINHVLIEAPDSYWARAIRAYQFAEAGNWHQADALTRTLQSESVREPFVEGLANCVRTHGLLPSLDLVPIHQF